MAASTPARASTYCQGPQCWHIFLKGVCEEMLKSFAGFTEATQMHRSCLYAIAGKGHFDEWPDEVFEPHCWQ